MDASGQYDVFLSYRRDTGVKDAMLIKLALENRGYRVFFDLSGLGAGRFGRQLYERIDECRDFVLIVSPHALDRCINEQDWLRLEIEYAHEKGKNIVPVLIDVKGIPDDLPIQINYIEELHNLKFSFDYFNHYNYFVTFIDTVSSFLQSEPVLSPSVPEQQSAPTPSSSATEKSVPPRKPAFVAGRDNVLMEDSLYATDKYYPSSARAFLTNLQRSQIETITFLDTLADAPKNARDLSQSKDKSVLSWTRKSSKGFDLYIAGEGGVSAPEHCQGLFMGYINVTSIDFNGAFHTDRATSFREMFRYCEKLAVVDLSSFHTGNVTDMFGMFSCCKSLTFLDVSSFNTSNVSCMSLMFSDCKSLRSLDVSSFDTSRVTYMDYMFFQCNSLRTLDVSNFDFSHVTVYHDFMPDSLDRYWKRYFTRK